MYGNGSFIRGAFLVRERELVKKGINSEMEWNTEILRAREYLQTLYRRAHGTCHDIEPRRDMKARCLNTQKGPMKIRGVRGVRAFSMKRVKIVVVQSFEKDACLSRTAPLCRLHQYAQSCLMPGKI